MSDTQEAQSEGVVIDREEFACLKEDLGSSLVPFVKLYLDKLPGYLTRMQELAQQNNWLELNREAHSLKGASQYLGAMVFGQICMELERSAKANDIDENAIKSNLSKLSVEAARVAAALPNLLE